MNLGHDHPDDLAFDVDENMDDKGPEALDIDDERAWASVLIVCLIQIPG